MEGRWRQVHSPFGARSTPYLPHAYFHWREVGWKLKQSNDGGEIKGDGLREERGRLDS